MAGARRQSRPSFLWQGLLILLPVVALSIYALSAVRQDRLEVKRRASEESRLYSIRLAQEIRQNLKHQIGASFLSAYNSSEINFPDGTRIDDNKHIVPMDAWRKFVPAFQHRWFKPMALGYPLMFLNRDGGLLVPTPCDVIPEPQPAILSELSEAQRNLWQHASGRMDSESAKVWSELYQQAPTPELRDLALFEYGLRLGTNGRSAAVEIFTRLQTNGAQRLNGVGIPLQPLASLQLLRMENQSADMTSLRSQLASNALAWPSILSPVLLQIAIEGVRRGADPGLYALYDQWSADEQTRALYSELRLNGGLQRLLRGGEPIWTTWENQEWLLVPARVPATNSIKGQQPAFGIYAFSETQLEIALLELANQPQKLQPPDYAEVSFIVHGRSIPRLVRGEILGEDQTDFALVSHPDHPTDPAVVSGIQIQTRLARPELLFAIQARRARVFGGLVACSSLTALIGLFFARRAFLQQLQLNEQKSNFVSSVSHELRAPIASVRLMAESLERGKISEPQKQNEYFRFIVQECRRLSSLIENVLDFSRIEQGRKQYEFEPADLLALAQETVKLMEPYAAEKGVGLRFETSNNEHSTFNAQAAANSKPETLNFELIVDGRAIQQAVINLVDNAVKHSAKGQSVTIAISHQPSAIGLSVSDNGPGIPASEHEKIFERFYRLGSELRRETQGVGIGLSIVKHIVEAHSGRVRVESEVGKGSRFTIELPVSHRDTEALR